MTMLQFSGIFINLSVRNTTRVPLWVATQELVTAYSTLSNPQEESLTKSELKKYLDKKQKISDREHSKKGKDSKSSTIKVAQFLNPINEMETLLCSVNSFNMTPEASLEIMIKLVSLVKKNELSFDDLNSDSRYKNLCRIVFDSQKTSKKSDQQNVKMNALQEFQIKHLGQLFDMAEIQKTINNPKISIVEVVQVMSKLAFYRSRVVPVLEKVTDRIINSNEEISIKVASDVMYSMAVLNFYNEKLAEKLVPVFISALPDLKAKNSAVIGSILKSIGILRFRNKELLSHLSTWMLKKYGSIRPQDVQTFLVTLAILDYVPTHQMEEFQAFTTKLKETDMIESYGWLESVWALAVLNEAQETQVMSVLNSEFLEKLTAVSKLTEQKKRKILNINAVATLIFKQNTDELLAKYPSILDVTLEKARDEQDFTNKIVSSLQALLPSTGCLKTDVNTGMGFSIGSEFYVDKNCNPILFSQVASKEKEALKLAMQSLSFFDYCRGDEVVTGVISFQQRILKLLNYHMLPVSYKEFQSNDKVVNRAKYLKNLIVETIKQSSN